MLFLLLHILAAHFRINAKSQKNESSLHKRLTEIPQWSITNKINVEIFYGAKKIGKKWFRMEFQLNTATKHNGNTTNNLNAFFCSWE